MFTHLRFAGDRVEAKTKAGEVAHEVFDLDDPEVVEYRRLIIDSLDLYEGKRKSIIAALEELERMKVEVPPPAGLDKAIATLAADLARTDQHLARLEGR